MKKWIALLLVVMFSLSLTTTAFATDDSQEAAKPDVTLLDFTYIVYTNCGFEISGNGVAECQASILCSTSIDRIRISSYLQKYDGGWVTVRHWTQDTYDNYATFDEVYNVVSGYAYRHYCYYYAYIDGDLAESATSAAYDSY